MDKDTRDSQKMMKDILIIGLVGLLWELLSSDRGELLTVVLFSLLVFFAIARNLRSRDIAVICGIGLLWEIILADSRSGVTIVLFGLPLFRLVLDTLAAQQSAPDDTSRRPIAWSSVSLRNLRGQLHEGLAGLGRSIKTREFKFELVAIVGMLSLGIGAAIYLTQSLGVSRQIIGYGALSYALGAVVFKGLLDDGLVVPFLQKRLSTSWLAITLGLVSALSELGAAALFFLFAIPRLSLPDLIGFGAAAGIIEAIIVPLMSIGGINLFSGTPFEKHAVDQWQDWGATPFTAMACPIVERGLTLVVHTSSRALIYAAILLGNIVPALIAVSLFACVDGLVSYALLNKWKVLSFRVAIKLYGVVAIAAAILTFVFWRLSASL